MNAYRIEINWGLIFIAMSLAWMALEKALVWHDEHIDKHAFYTNFVAIPAILIDVFALIEKYNKYYGGSMNYFSGFNFRLNYLYCRCSIKPNYTDNYQPSHYT
jgi:hypothetical protein